MTPPLRATIQWLCRFAEAIAIVALVAATALIMLQIVAREVFVAGVSWADELARYAGLTVIFMGVPALLARDEHVKVDMFLNMMRPRARHFVSVTNDLLMVVFGAMFLVAGWQFMQRAARFATPALRMPNLIFYLPAIIGMTLMLLVAIDRAVAALTAGAKDDAAP
jgi:TRAP-type C4-dicarboxylate transport system permease small subunit